MVQCEILEILRKIEMTIGQRYLYRPPATPLPWLQLSLYPWLLPLLFYLWSQFQSYMYQLSQASIKNPPPPPPPTPPINHPEPLPLNHMYFNTPLTSEQIPKHTLMSIEDSLKGCKELKSIEKASTLAQKLAKEAIFGVEIMKRCTPGGNK